MVALLFFFIPVISAADPNSPHLHSGILNKYQRCHPSRYPDEKFSLTTEDLALLYTGQAVLRVVSDRAHPSGARSSAAFVKDVAAPPGVVWDVLADFAGYPKHIDPIVACSVYERHRMLPAGEVVRAQYKVKIAPAICVQYFMEHRFEQLTKRSMTFHLDYGRCSDIPDCVGYWYVEPHMGGQHSRVFYATDQILPGWIPAPIRSTFIRIGCNRATANLEPACLIRLAERTATSTTSQAKSWRQHLGSRIRQQFALHAKRS
mmetsp:Transcript_47850/g.79192  ORF Transcript_47850/g.79192 Transcript_47850/m.79192 type:complete len:261 (+) Transcript_47850:227-1009(+)